MQERSNEEIGNLLVQSIVSRDEKLLKSVLDIEDDACVKDVINRLPANYVRKLLIELGNLLSADLSIRHLRWLQHLLALKYSIVSSMSDGRSILMPLISLLEDRSSPEYYNKVQKLKGKIALLQHLREGKKSNMASTVVRVPAEIDKSNQMEVDSDTETESEDELDDNEDQSQKGDEEESAKDDEDDPKQNEDQGDELFDNCDDESRDSEYHSDEGDE